MSKSNNNIKNRVVGLIPARGGSKGIPKKNIKLLGGFHLIAYSIIAAKLSGKIERTIISTDSQEIKDIALFYGAEVPFTRPPELATDNSTDMEFFLHALEWLEKNEGIRPELLVQLRPTTPLRLPQEIDRAIGMVESHPHASSLRSAHELPESPHKMFRLDGDGFFKAYMPDDTKAENFNLPRQAFAKAYHPNGYVDIVRTEIIEKTKSLYGPKILAFVTAFSAEVDTAGDFEYLEYALTKAENPVYNYLKKHFTKGAAKNVAV